MPQERQGTRTVIDALDKGLQAYAARPVSDNRSGGLAWGDSYFLMACAEAYKATDARRYLSLLTKRFDQLLALRDDRLGKADAFAGKPLAGWGSEKYSAGKWHVWIAHTGMILQGPAAVSFRLPELHQCLADTDAYWHDGPRAGEGYFTDPHLGKLLPLNQQNALGSTLVSLQPERAAKLARFFKNRLRQPERDRYDWGYWPKENDNEPGRSEDISHAGLNIAFAVRCFEAGLVFDKADLLAFANTWLRTVRRDDQTWAETVGGTGKANSYRPGAIAEWLPLLPHLPSPQREALYRDAQTALLAKPVTGPRELLGLARLPLAPAERRN